MSHRIGRPPEELRVPDEAILAALKDSNGIIMVAASRVNLHRDTVRKRINRNPALRAVYLEERASLCDRLEGKLLSQIFPPKDSGRECDTRCLMFALERLHPDFKQTLTVSPPEPEQEMTDAELENRIEELIAERRRAREDAANDAPADGEADS